MRRPLVTIAVTGTALVVAGAALVVGRSYVDHDPGQEPYVDPVSVDCSELLASYRERGAERVGPYGWNTPAQAGVDEPDVVETDGRSLFRIEDGDLVTYDGSGTDVVRFGSTDLPGFTDADGPQLLLSDDTVIALAQTGQRSTRVVSLDVSDPAVPVVTHTIDYATSLVTARLHDGVVRLVLQGGLPDLDFVVPDHDTSPAEAERTNRRLVESAPIDAWVPTVTIDDAPTTSLLTCDDILVPDATGSPDLLGTLAVVRFEVATPGYLRKSAIALDPDLVHLTTSTGASFLDVG